MVRRLGRRLFVKELVQGTVAVAVLGLTAASCARENDAGGEDGWHRVSFGFVSAYILARNRRTVIVDTGVAGSEDDIEAGLASIGQGWDSTDHLILTHLHADHIGSAEAVMRRASSASAHAGAADLDAIRSPRPVNAVGDGDEVFGLQIIETPGHTPGHISVFDPDRSVLVAGDAMNGADGGVIGANPRFTADMDLANASIQKLAGLGADTVYFGHGEPVISGAGRLISELAADLR